MRDILFLSHRLPYPPDRGDRIRSWHVLKALAKIAPVHVCALLDNEADRAHVPMVQSVAASVTVACRRKFKLAAVIEASATGRSASVLAFTDRTLMDAVHQRLKTVDIVYAFSSQMAAYVPSSFAGRFVMDFVDMDSAKFAAMGFFARQEAKRLKAWEIATAKRANISIFVSSTEAALFKRETGLSARVMENGVDLAHFVPGVVPPVHAPYPLIVFTGQMDYAPNIGAVTEFVGNALPAIRAEFPVVRFAIVGRAPSAAVRALAGPSVIVTGEVADTRPWLGAASVVVAPLQIARGVQNKLLEAMAMGKACVASSGAARGLNIVDSRELIVADDPAVAVVALLRDPERRRAIGLAARERMLASFSWDKQLEPLAEFVGR